MIVGTKANIRDAHGATSNQNIAENIGSLPTFAGLFPSQIASVEVDYLLAIEECLHSSVDLYWLFPQGL